MAIITISREMGTGALQIASEVARKLKYQLIDGTRIAQLAPAYGLTSEMLDRVDEKPPAYITNEDRIQAANLKTVELILLDAARKGNVILYGRGGQDLLVGLGNVLRVRCIAPFDERVEKFAEREWIDPDLARELIRKSDHQRGGFIHFYFDRNWNDPLEYDITINTAKISTSAAVDAIVAAAKDTRLKDAEIESNRMLDDIILIKKVETELLRSGSVSSLHFRIDVRDGNLLLSGHVHTNEEKMQVLSVVSRIEEAGTIIDDLHIIQYRQFRE